MRMQYITSDKLQFSSTKKKAINRLYSIGVKHFVSGHKQNFCIKNGHCIWNVPDYRYLCVKICIPSTFPAVDWLRKEVDIDSRIHMQNRMHVCKCTHRE